MHRTFDQKPGNGWLWWYGGRACSVVVPVGLTFSAAATTPLHTRKREEPNSHFAKTTHSQCPTKPPAAKSETTLRVALSSWTREDGFDRSILLAWRSWRAGRCPDGAEGAEAAVVLADGDEAPSRLAGRQDPPHLVQGLLPQAVRLRSHARAMSSSWETKNGMSVRLHKYK